MNKNNENIFSSIVISDDNTSKLIKVNKSTKLENFYQQIINQFQLNDNLNMQLFYYEGYSHQIEMVTNKDEFIIANKKGIESFIFALMTTIIRK